MGNDIGSGLARSVVYDNFSNTFSLFQLESKSYRSKQCWPHRNFFGNFFICKNPHTLPFNYAKKAVGSSVIGTGRSEDSLLPYFYRFQCHYPLITYLSFWAKNGCLYFRLAVLASPASREANEGSFPLHVTIYMMQCWRNHWITLKSSFSTSSQWTGAGPGAGLKLICQQCISLTYYQHEQINFFCFEFYERATIEWKKQVLFFLFFLANPDSLNLMNVQPLNNKQQFFCSYFLANSD